MFFEQCSSEKEKEKEIKRKRERVRLGACQYKLFNIRTLNNVKNYKKNSCIEYIQYFELCLKNLTGVVYLLL